MLGKRNWSEPPARIRVGETETGVAERRCRQSARLVISQAGRCRRGAPRCFATCICDMSLGAERAPVHGEGEAWTAAELADRVARLDDQLPPEGWEHESALMIDFAPGHKVHGTTALLFAGDFLLDETGTYQMIRPRTRRILDALAIPYTTVAPES